MSEHMEVIIVGSGTCVPSLRRSGPCQVVRAFGYTIMIDSAAGSLRQLLRAGIRQDDIDLILYTHFHPDHTGELVPFIFASKYSPSFKRKKPVLIWGPEGLSNLLAGFVKAWGEWAEPEEGRVVFEEIPVSMMTSQQFPPFVIKTVHTKHTPHSLAYRIEGPGGKTIVFSGDTEYCEELVELSRGADLLVQECAAPEGKRIQGHMTPSHAGRLASSAQVKRLLLTHFYPECDRSDLLTPCKRRYQGPVILAEDLMRIIV